MLILKLNKLYQGVNMKLPKGLSVIEHNSMVLGKLYNTMIVEYNQNTNSLKLRNGGWQTKHTKKCINLILNKFGLYLVQEKFIWNLYHNGTLLGSFQNDTLEVVL